MHAISFPRSINNTNLATAATAAYITLYLISFHLFLSGLVQRGILEQPASVVNLHDVPVDAQFAVASFRDVLLAGVFCESPLEGFQNLLPSGELELAPSDRLDDVRFG